MNRLFWFFLYAGSGLTLIAWGFLVPSYLRAVDAAVLERARADTPTLIQAGQTLVNLEKIGPAEMILEAAHRAEVRESDRLDLAVTQFSQAHPNLLIWGGADLYLEQIFRGEQLLRPLEPRPVAEILLRREVREILLQALRQSRRPGVETILKTREITRTIHFPPVFSPSGQPLESAILLAALLLQGDYLTSELRENIENSAREAIAGGETTPLETLYLDLISLGKRLNWVQLTEFIRQIEDPIVLRDLAHLARIKHDQLPILYSAVHLSGQPEAVAQYLMHFGETGMDDLGFSLRSGMLGVREVLQRQQRVHYPWLRGKIVSHNPFQIAFVPLLDISLEAPQLALAIKYSLFLLGAFLTARSIQFLRRVPSLMEQRLLLKEIGATRQGLFAFTFLLVMMVLGEPFLAQANEAIHFPVRWQFPTSGAALVAQITTTTLTPMNQMTILALVIFLVIQLIIYTLCLLKLAEIRRQPISSSLKLKLLDNEENMFDAGLYFGLGGTVGALVFLALGIIDAGIMSAYASTLFGIIFVALLKICHLRPFRRRLILESELLPA
jgi:hypothetical protein